MKFLISIASLLAAFSSVALSGADWSQKVAKSLEGITAENPKQERKLLVYSVTRGYRHKSIPTGLETMRLMAQKTGAFEVVISDDMNNFEPGVIGQHGRVLVREICKPVRSSGGEKTN